MHNGCSTLCLCACFLCYKRKIQGIKGRFVAVGGQCPCKTGTLFCETDPDYIDHMFLVYRVLMDPEYKDKASAFEKEVANQIVEKSKTSSPVGGLDVPHGQALASAFKGTTLEQFSEHMAQFKKTPMPSYDGMNRGDGFYLPMLQIVELLERYGFTSYIVTGTDRFLIRGLSA